MGNQEFNMIKERFIAWWNRENVDRPLMRIVAKKTSIPEMPLPENCRDIYLDVHYRTQMMRHYCRYRTFFAEAYPSLDINIGPGSVAAYLGAEPIFTWNTIWFEKCIDDWEEFGGLIYDENNYWWRLHLNIVQEAVKLADGEYLVNIPDILENVDILSAMRGPEALCMDLIDNPEVVKDYISQVDNLYFKYYDAFYNIVKGEDSGSSYTAFKIWGPGKTAKVQCDFCALMSPGQFREFVLPSLRLQCQQLDNSIYHLDGPDAIKHVDALMEIDELDALQWSPGAGRPDGGDECWYPIYDKVKDANKSLWISIRDGDVNEWIRRAGKLVKRYGSEGLYLLFPDMEEEEAIMLLRTAERNWR